MSATDPTPTPTPTAGWKTSEGRLTLAHLLFAALATAGVLSLGDARQLEGAVTAALVAGMALYSSSLVIWQYIQSRTRLKETQALAAQVPEPAGVAGPPSHQEPPAPSAQFASRAGDWPV